MRIRCSSSLTLYWDRPFEETYTDAEGTPEYQRRKAVSVASFPAPDAHVLTLRVSCRSSTTTPSARHR